MPQQPCPTCGQAARVSEVAGIIGPAAVAAQCQDLIEARQEHMVGLYLNVRHEVIHRALLALGSLTQCIVHPREVFAPALEQRAAAVILVHNHPSGDPTPSEEDRRLTQRMEDAGTLLGIPLLDHVVVAAGGWKSINGL